LIQKNKPSLFRRHPHRNHSSKVYKQTLAQAAWHSMSCIATNKTR